MIIIYAISLILLLAYIVVLLRYCRGWIQLSEHKTPDRKTKTGVSIIIPCRNEGKNISTCLEKISKLDFPRGQFEIIVVDDHSTDDTGNLAQLFFKSNPALDGRVIPLAKANQGGKKEAISLGVEVSKNPLIVTTDADCLVPPSWLKSGVSFYEQTGAKMIAAPVTISPSNSFIQELQELEILGLQAVAGASIQLAQPVLCSGANLFYEKEAFRAVGGYNDNAQIKSGDDLFLLQKVRKKYPGLVKFLKTRDACIQTAHSSSTRDFVKQRKRWVSKVIYIPDATTIAVAFIVYLTNLLLIIDLALWALLPDFNGSLLIITFGVKALTDFWFLHLATSFFGRGYLMRSFVLAELFYIIYVTVIGVLGNIAKYNWKGRSSGQGMFLNNNS